MAILLYQLAQIGSHLLLNPYPTVLCEPIEDANTDLASYLANWIDYLTTQALLGYFLSDCYFIIKFVAGLHPLFASHLITILNITSIIHIMTIIPYLLISLWHTCGFDFSSVLFLLASKALLQLLCKTINVSSLSISYQFLLFQMICLLLDLIILFLLLLQHPLLVSSVMILCILLQLVHFCFVPSLIPLLDVLLFAYCKISILLSHAHLLLNIPLLLALLIPIHAFMLFLLNLNLIPYACLLSHWLMMSCLTFFHLLSTYLISLLNRIFSLPIRILYQCF